MSGHFESFLNLKMESLSHQFHGSFYLIPVRLGDGFGVSESTWGPPASPAFSWTRGREGTSLADVTPALVTPRVKLSLKVPSDPVPRGPGLDGTLLVLVPLVLLRSDTTGRGVGSLTCTPSRVTPH